MTRRNENLAIIGLQWGDEGKGKLVDLLSANFRHTVRFQGGNNAGHTVVVNGESIALHQIPCGALHPSCFLIVGSGVVLNLEVFHKELESLRTRGIDVMDRLLLSDKAHLILPYHIAIDNWREDGTARIGTTGRGIGPAYEAKAARLGVRLGDLKTPCSLLNKVSMLHKEASLKTDSESSLPSPEAVIERLTELGTPLLECVGNAQEHLYSAWKRGESILFEGAQATMLDIDHGTYPYVTSSNCSIGGIFTGTGLPPKALQKTLGVAKAYATRVGAGPFPSELNNSIGEHLRTTGNEFGTTTGRPRRCGWLDTVMLRHACLMNGVDGIGLMKLDVLDGLNKIGLVKEYRDKSGDVITALPSSIEDWENIVPVTELFDGWTSPTMGIKAWDNLPSQAKIYINAIEELTETAVAYISTGPDREVGLIPQKSFLTELL